MIFFTYDIILFKILIMFIDINDYINIINKFEMRNETLAIPSSM